MFGGLGEKPGMRLIGVMGFGFGYFLFLFEGVAHQVNFIIFEALHDELGVQHRSAVGVDGEAGHVWHDLVQPRLGLGPAQAPASVLAVAERIGLRIIDVYGDVGGILRGGWSRS